TPSFNSESPVLPVGRRQLNGVANASLKELCQTRPDYDRAGVVAKIIKVPVNELVKDIGSLRVQGRINAVKVDGGVLKSRASTDRSPQHRRTGNDVGKLPAHPHDFIRVSDAFEIEATSHRGFGAFRGNHERFVAWSKTRSDHQRAITADG